MNLLAGWVVAMVLVIAAASAQAGTREDVAERGYLQCGVSTGLPGTSSLDEKGNWAGLDVDLCRAVAAATLGDAGKVKYIPLNAGDRFAALQSGEIDILARVTTWNLTRDSSLGFNFAGVLYYDGQGFLVARKLGAKKSDDLDGASICVQKGTTSEANLAAFFRKKGMTFKPVAFASADEAIDGLQNGVCQVLTSDGIQLHGMLMRLARPDSYVILPDIISKEPLGPVVRHGDDNWFDVVRWSLIALIAAEELGISSENVGQSMNSEDPAVQRFVGRQGTGWQGLGLKADWAAQIIRQVGNYGEVFERNVGKKSPLKIERGLNNLWNKGGLQYAPPME